ncbi:hypothetical protein [Dorea formicigenerans]|uniref:Uncharacterized protein n=1 Tax=Dorea formicigenerans TaxID=39486 RepID=A0A3E4MBM9_9FIRM|nr:hypothetical protein [Dorea formicigenerans]RGK47005.1 hypothetical protein DXD10_09955 [Dorea formicigenerans]
MIESINTLMILADECISAYNVQVRFNPWMPPMLYQDVIDGIQNPPEPVLMKNGIELLYPMFMPKVIEIIPTNDKVLTDVLAVIMPEVESWNNHPAKYVTYKVTDKNGASAKKTITVTVKQNTGDLKAIMNRGIVMSSYSKTFLKRIVKILEVNIYEKVFGIILTIC